MKSTFELTKATNALLMSLAAVPVFLWTRRLASFGWSLGAAVLVLCMPAFAFAGLVMTENIAFPTFVLALYLTAFALERPTVPRQVLALSAIGLASISRYQNLILLPVFVGAAFVKLGLDWRAGVPRDELRRRALHLVGAVGIALGLAVLYLAWKLASHQPLSSGLGPYQGLESGKYPLRDVVRWTVLNAGEWVIATGFLGAAALVLLTSEGVAGRLRTDVLRSFVAVGVVAVVGVLVEVGLFASGVAQYIVERYTFYAIPVALIALVAWLANGLPRPRIGLVTAIGIPLACVLSILTLDRDPLNDGSLPVNTLTLFALQRLTLRLGADARAVLTLTGIGIVAAALAFAFLPRRLAVILFPVGLAVVLLAFSRPVTDATAGSSLLERGAAGTDPTWVDQAAGAGSDVPYLLMPSADVQSASLVSLETEYWNRSVDSVYSLGATQICPLPSIAVEVDPTTGRIQRVGGEPLDPKYIVAPRGSNIAGTVVANGGLETLLPLSVYRVQRPLRVGSVVSGIDADGWMHAAASYTGYSAPPGRGAVDVTVSRSGWIGQDVPGNVSVTSGKLGLDANGELAIVGPKREEDWVIHSGLTKTIRISVPRPPYRVEVHVDPTFSPSQFGAPDTRQLGAQTTFVYVPGG